MRHGFSLVELSIVLVILGLLTGGILAGQSLIRAAELRSISTDTSRYVAAVYSFRDKYFALPGDMNNATKFWGDDNAACPDAAVVNGTPGTCNGDGNGQVIEIFRYWQHLALAGLIEGQYSGTGTDAVPGTNVPRGRLGDTGYTVSYQNYVPGDWANTQMNYGNQITFGKRNPGYDTSGPVLQPEEQWNVDTKIDDGRPGQGRIIANYWDTCTTATSFTDYNGDYDFSVKYAACAFRYKDAGGN